MKDRLEQIKEEVRKQVEAAGTLDKLNEVRVNALGKKGALTEMWRQKNALKSARWLMIQEQKSKPCWK